MNLTQIIDQLRSEHPPRTANGRPKGKLCKHCGCALAVAQEDPTIVHTRHWVSDIVVVETLYKGKYFCQWCHRYQNEDLRICAKV